MVTGKSRYGVHYITLHIDGSAGTSMTYIVVRGWQMGLEVGPQQSRRRARGQDLAAQALQGWRLEMGLKPDGNRC